MQALFARKLVLTCKALVRFGDALDAIFELAITLRELLGHDVAAASGAAIYDVDRERDSLVYTEFMLCHLTVSGFGRLPFRGAVTMSNDTRCPTLSVVRPARLIPLI